MDRKEEIEIVPGVEVASRCVERRALDTAVGL